MTTHLQFGAALAVVASLCAPAARAHGDHGGGGGTVLPEGITLVTLDYEIMRYKPLSDSQLTASEPGPHAVRQIAVPTVSLGYGLTPDFTIAARLPYLANRDIKEVGEADPAVVSDRGGIYGLGDLSLTGTWRFYQDVHSGFEANVVFGVKAPTGRTQAFDRQGERFETHHQAGSGSWDGLVGGGVSQHLWSSVAVSANVLYALTGEGTADTNTGDRLSYAIAATHRLWSSQGASPPQAHPQHSLPEGLMHHGGIDHAGSDGTPPMALDVSLGLTGHWSGNVRLAGLVDPDTGGHVLSVTPGLRLSVGSLTSFVDVGVPIVEDLNGLQSRPRWQLSTGMSVQF